MTKARPIMQAAAPRADHPEPSLFARLVVRVTAVLALGAVGLSLAAWFYARTAADVAYDRLLQGAAVQIVESLAVVDGRLEAAVPASAFKLLALAERDRIFYRVIAPDGQTLTGYDDLETGDKRVPKGDEVVFHTHDYRGVRVRTALAGRTIYDPAPGRAYVIVAQTTEARLALVSELTSRTMVLVGVMSLIGLIGAGLAVRYALVPVNRLGAALRNRDPQDLTTLAVAVPRELTPFVGSINHFMHRFDAQLRQSQQFVADSAHQLRTPLTAISAQLNLIDETGMDADNRRHLARARSRAADMARFVNQLLSHALVIHRSETTPLAPVDLVLIARQAFRAAVPITIDPDIVVSFEAPDRPVIVRADGLSLREAITNVIDNAVRHGSVARLEVRVVVVDDDHATVEVEDDGQGIAPEDWHRVTQRFASTQAGRGGTGLGFAIAAEVAQAHAGHLNYRRSIRGFTVLLTLPTITADPAPVPAVDPTADATADPTTDAATNHAQKGP